MRENWEKIRGDLQELISTADGFEKFAFEFTKKAAPWLLMAFGCGALAASVAWLCIAALIIIVFFV